MICMTCGHALRPGKAFCSGCGSPVAVISEVPAATGSDERGAPPDRTLLARRPWLIARAGLLLAVLVAAVGYLLVQSSG
ncbi:MAG: hypothetical protein QG671_4127 [Actinomycetota bacterium]|jgi:hypothetical protein|nr:hypothetical protein [Actinomycetota bacterium]MDQ5975082.1 hypothetical protein [Actinomycetota bacterium]